MFASNEFFNFKINHVAGRITFYAKEHFFILFYEFQIHLVFYKQLVYKQLALGCQIAK